MSVALPRSMTISAVALLCVGGLSPFRALSQTGSCCLNMSVCMVLTPAECARRGGVYGGDGTPCPGPCAGACCIRNLENLCIVVSLRDCQTFMGVYFGVGTTCGPATCLGACCTADGVCRFNTRDSCDLVGGTFLGLGTTCETNTCRGACCIFGTGACEILSPQDCAPIGTFRGRGTTCVPTPCPGACCLPSGACETLGEQACLERGGVYHGGLTLCTGYSCPGPCCLPDGTCEILPYLTCHYVRRGFFQGYGIPCDSVVCPPGEPRGACCLYGGAGCVVLPEIFCATNGHYLGDGTVCASELCERVRCCLPTGFCTVGPRAICQQEGGIEIGDIQCTVCPGVCTGVRPGDANGDGRVDNFDLEPFWLGIRDRDEYVRRYCPELPALRVCRLDMTCRNYLDNYDLEALIRCLVDPTTCPLERCR